METSNSSRKSLLLALRNGDSKEVRRLFSKLPGPDAAEIFDDLAPRNRSSLIQHLQPSSFLPVLPHLDPDDIEALLAEFAEEDISAALDSLPDDELTDFLQSLDQAVRDRYFSRLSAEKRETAQSLIRYPETSAGGRMTTAFAAVPEHITLREAIESLEDIREQTEILARIYVVDQEKRILGKVRLRDLTFNRRSLRISDIMSPEPAALEASADQEEAVRIILKYDLLSLPVIDEDKRLVGIITHDDAMEILQEESTEDLERQSGIAGSQGEMDYLETPVLTHFKRRFFWVLGLAFLAIVSGLVIHYFEGTLKAYFLLTLYMPMVVATGGNTGAQAATSVIRAMSLGEFDPSSYLQAIWKEIRIGAVIGILLGACVAIVNEGILTVWPDSDIADLGTWKFGLVVAISLMLQVTSSTFIGAALPILAKSARLDPAVVASPAITTIVDVTGLIIYFVLAQSILGL